MVSIDKILRMKVTDALSDLRMTSVKTGKEEWVDVSVMINRG